MANNIIIRSITGILFIAIIVAAIFYGKYSFFLLLEIVVLLGMLESSKLSQKKITPKSLLYAIITLCIFILYNIDILFESISLTEIKISAFALLFCIPAIELLCQKQPSVKTIGITLSMLIILIISFSALMTVFSSINGKMLVFAFFCIIWTYDTFAFLTGILVGRHRICETISPKKSWEGAIGGLNFAIVLSIIFYITTDIFGIWQWIFFAIIISVFGTIGDFCESMLKRHFNVKDSGNLLPGHGGILDRFDSAIFAAPFILLYLQIISTLS